MRNFVFAVLASVALVQAQTAWPTLSFGDKGDNVQSLQHLLLFNGESQIDTDGIYGNETETSVIRFQERKGVLPNGIVGEETWLNLCPLVVNGQRGDGVTALQIQLNKHNEGVSEDGIFGAGTETAVKSIQSRAGLTETGKADMDTWRESLGRAAGTLPQKSKTVQDMIYSSCSTTSVKGLSQQLVDTVNKCLHKGLLKDFSHIPKIVKGSAVFPYMQANGVSALERAMAASSRTMYMNSAYRSLAQQLLLYQWYLSNRCGITLAAKPGTSNHESALAFDIDEGSSWSSFLSGYSFKWLGTSDPPHYDYVGSGTIEIRPSSTKAFQMLWNVNNPTDQISVDGQYGPETEKRLLKSPADGFPKPVTC